MKSILITLVSSEALRRFQAGGRLLAAAESAW